MAADVIVTYDPDPDPLLTSAKTTFLVNGTAVGDVTVGPTVNSVNYSAISPAPPALALGDVVTTQTVTTDNQNQNSPIVPGGPLTITQNQPPPGGVTNVALRQVGSP